MAMLSMRDLQSKFLVVILGGKRNLFSGLVSAEVFPNVIAGREIFNRYIGKGSAQPHTYMRRDVCSVVA